MKFAITYHHFLFSTIQPGMVVEKQVELKAYRRTQDHMLLVMCCCKQIGEITGATLITVK